MFDNIREWNGEITINFKLTGVLCTKFFFSRLGILWVFIVERVNQWIETDDSGLRWTRERAVAQYKMKSNLICCYCCDFISTHSNCEFMKERKTEENSNLEFPYTSWKKQLQSSLKMILSSISDEFFTSIRDFSNIYFRLRLFSPLFLSRPILAFSFQFFPHYFSFFESFSFFAHLSAAATP